MIFLMIPFFAIIGSFLNMLGYRLVHEDIPFFTTRSTCPKCKNTIAWYDLIPIISWILLQGSCRTCNASISILYPCIEFFTICVLSLLLLTYNLTPLFFSYALFFCALIVTIRTDIDTMLISCYVTWTFVPIAWLLAYYTIIPLSFIESCSATIVGYISLWTINKLYKTYKKIDGIGAGDFDLFAMIAAWTGFLGGWATITIGAFFGSFFGIILLLSGYDSKTPIPFGPFLALGAILFVLYNISFSRIVTF